MDKNSFGIAQHRTRWNFDCLAFYASCQALWQRDIPKHPCEHHLILHHDLGGFSALWWGLQAFHITPCYLPFPQRSCSGRCILMPWCKKAETKDAFVLWLTGSARLGWRALHHSSTAEQTWPLSSRILVPSCAALWHTPGHHPCSSPTGEHVSTGRSKMPGLALGCWWREVIQVEPLPEVLCQGQG